MHVAKSTKLRGSSCCLASGSRIQRLHVDYRRRPPWSCEILASRVGHFPNEDCRLSLHFTTLGRMKLTPTLSRALYMDHVQVTAEAPLESCSLCHTTFSGTAQFCRRGTCRVEYLRSV
ncbi:hypothetical protein V5799_032714 [Amblyomma americanum]|uniref:Uncharacterized protein n=1 Tax=Amblyomma americanum TaxID=6943 RepID=A0AAQ4DQD8_AMBAM